MRSFRIKKKEISTIKELYMHSFEDDRCTKNKVCNKSVRIIDLSPPSEENLPYRFKNARFWAKGRKQDYERGINK